MRTTNYGLAGGELDATKHLERAIPILLTGGERKLYCDARLDLIVNARAQVGRQKPDRN